MNTTPRFVIPWFVIRPLELLVAVLVVFLLTSYLDQKERDRFDLIPADEWFEVTELFVPDHEQGENPLLAYDRVVKEEFRGFWVVEVKSRDAYETDGRFFTACSGNGASDYGPDAVIDPSKVTWSWFIGRSCEVPPGVYRLEVTWDMKVPEFDLVKRYTALSNPFRVYAPGTTPQF